MNIKKIIILFILFLSGLMYGCNQPNSVILNNGKELDSLISLREPAFVEFFKGACPTCVVQDISFEKMAADYKNRVNFGRMQFLNMVFVSPCPEVKKKYNLQWAPTVILFHRGREIKRWVGNCSYEDMQLELMRLQNSLRGRFQ